MQSFVCLVSAEHPRIRGALSRAQFEAEDHVVVNSSGAAPLVLDREIARLGIARRVALQLPNFLGAAFVVEQTHHIITIPQRLGEMMQHRGALQLLHVPFALPDYSVKQHWHERYHHDPGSRWLRAVISGLLLASPKP
jgi:DNA-binding transcriptional LysR family regulator